MFVKNNPAQRCALRGCIILGLSIWLVSLSWGVVLAQSVTIDEGASRTTGVNVPQDDAVVTNNGAITTSEFAAIYSEGAGATITNSETGTIETSADDSTAIYSEGADAVITNSGTIRAQGVHSEGIYSEGAGATITNSETGTIETTGEAISVHGHAAVITSTGTISTAGFQSHGIFLGGNDGTIEHSGAISTTGDSSLPPGNSGDESDGIFSRGSRTNITNSGTIETTGSSAKGISALGDVARITNSGNVSTTGDDAHAIFSTGVGATITNSGTISTTGANAHGISAEGRATINVSGGVSATGEGSYAVRGSDENDQTLTLLPGARISGRINLGEKVEPTTDPPPVFVPDNDVLNIKTNTVASSRTYVTEGVESFGLGALAMRNGDTVVVVDPTAQSATRITLGMTTGRIHRQVFQRLASSVRGKPANKGAWGTFLGSYTERGEDGRAQAWKHSFYGGVGGYDARLSGGQRVGLFAGGGWGGIRTSTASVKDDASRAFFGTYGQQELAMGARGKLTLDGSILFGYARHDSRRKVWDNLAGYETADGGYNSFYISPSLAITYARALGSGFELRPSAQFAYTHGHYGAYTESGTVRSNLNMGSRRVNIMDGRMQLALARSFADDRGEVEWRGGATLAYYHDDSVGASLGGGTAISYPVPGDDVIPGGYTGVRLNYAISDYAAVGADVEYVRRSGHEDSVFGYLRLAIQF